MTTASTLTAQSVLVAALQSAHWILEATMADVTDEVANRPAPGNANSVGSSYAHAIFAEDAVVSGMLRGSEPLAASAWAGRTGFDRPMPMPGTGGHDGDLGEWYRSVHVDVAACREYAQAVANASIEFVTSADDEALARPIDMSFVGQGSVPVSSVLTTFVIGHLNNLCGEIAAVKGAFGLRGYPF
jgi:DinB family protein